MIYDLRFMIAGRGAGGVEDFGQFFGFPVQRFQPLGWKQACTFSIQIINRKS